MTTATTLPQGVRDAGDEFPSALWAKVLDTASILPGKSIPEQATGDEAWIARVRAGDEDAARALIEHLYPTVLKLVRCRLPRRTSEEDLAQTVFAKVFSKLDQFSGNVPLEHWVSRIAVNTCFNQLRYELVRPEVRMSDLSRDEEAIVQQLASTDDDLPGSCSDAAQELVEKLLARLNPDERLVITLLHIEERSVKEICDRTGWTNTLVKVRAFRARRKMRKLWKTLLNAARE
ncbi:MAG: sigma-70 family RNA polymerase sigma factor [Verrucomicrobiales bacterium]|nr:sigma-70 family RNA polymerase sigma factor [Verrucomicrobiales bacterium]